MKIQGYCYTLFIIALVGCAPVSKLPKIDEARAEAERAKQYELLVLDHIKAWGRLHQTAYPILLNNVDRCGEKVGKSFSFKMISADSFGEDIKKHALDAGVSERPYIISVPKGSSADISGILQKDVIMAIGDWKIPEKNYQSELTNQLEKQSQNKSSLPITVKRNNKEFQIDVPLDLICDFALVLDRSEVVNAYADGKRLLFSTAIMNLLQDDNELAAVIGHEMAHNTMGHIDKKQANAAVGFVFDLLLAGVGINTQGAISNASRSAYSQDFEAEADYVGLYYMYHAGYDIQKAPTVWRRMSINSPDSIQKSSMSSHPSSPARFIALEDTVKEIQQKIKNGEPIIPNEGYEYNSGTATKEPDTNQQDR